MYRIRLYKLINEEGFEYGEEYFTTKHYGVTRKEDMVYLTLYDKYTKEKGVSYTIGKKGDYDAMFVKKDGEIVDKYNSL